METTVTQDHKQIRLNKYVEDIRANQNLSLGIAGGAVAAVLGAILWGVITYVTGFQIGWMAVGVGFLVGYAVRRFGRGVDISFGISGAALALAGCAMGNLFASCIAIANQYQLPVFQVVLSLNWPVIAEIYTQTFNPIDLLFYGIAIYEGYRFSFYRIPQDELDSILKQ